MPNNADQSDDRATLIDDLFAASRRANEATLADNRQVLVDTADAMIACWTRGGHILACGNGGSAGDAQHFASELVNRFERDRRALPVIGMVSESSTLTAIANDAGYDRVFARQVEAFGRPGDLLLAISTSGHSGNIVAAIEQAKARGMDVIAMTGRDGGRIAGQLGEDDIELRASDTVTARIQEMHLLMIHCICRLIEDWLARAD